MHNPNTDQEGETLCKSHQLHLKLREKEMKRKKEMYMEHGDESKYLNLQHEYSYHKDYRRRNFITNSSDIDKIISVKNQDTFLPTLTHTLEKNYLKEPLIENIVKSDMLSDGFLNLDVTPNAKSFKMTPPIKTKKKKRSSGEYFDTRKTTCMLYLQADHLFYEKMGRSEEACIEVMTRHVQGVNSIYRAVGKLHWNAESQFDNIFVV